MCAGDQLLRSAWDFPSFHTKCLKSQECPPTMQGELGLLVTPCIVASVTMFLKFP